MNKKEIIEKLISAIHEWAYAEEWIGKPFHWDCPFCENIGIAQISTISNKVSFNCKECSFNYME